MAEHKRWPWNPDFLYCPDTGRWARQVQRDRCAECGAEFKDCYTGGWVGQNTLWNHRGHVVDANGREL